MRAGPRATPLAAAALAGLLGCGGPGLAREPEARPAVVRVGPAATLRQALDEAGALRAASPDRPVAIQLPPGTLRLGAAVELDPLDGGTAAAPLVIRGAPGGTVLSGSVAVSPLAVPLPEAIAARLPEAARAHVRLYRLPPGAIADGRAERASLLQSRPPGPPLEVYDATGALAPARWPREGWARTGAGAEPPAAPALALATPGAPPLAGEPDLWVEGYFSHDWLYELVPVARAEGGRLDLGAPPYEGVVKPGARVRIVHALGALDAPGEWWRDPASGLLVAWPRDPAGRLEVAVADGLLRLRDVSHLRIEGVAFEHARGDALRVEGGEDVVVERGRVSWVGGNGIVFAGARRGGVENCTVTDTGGVAVYLEGGDRAALSPGGLFLRHSILARFGRLIPTQTAGLEVAGVGAEVEGNRFSDSGDPAIGIHGNDHRIVGNDLSHLLAGVTDIGAIYSGRDWTARGTLIADNVLHDIRADPGFEVKGIYLDDFASGFTIRDNLFVRVDQPVFIGGGRDNAVVHNLFVASSPAIHVDSRGQTWSAAAVRDPGSELRRRLAAMPVSSPPWRRYPGLAGLLDDEPAVAERNRIEGNAFVASRPFDFSDGGDRSRQAVSGNVGPDGMRSAGGPDRPAPAERAADPRAFADLLDPSGRRFSLRLPSPGPRHP